MSEMQDDHKEEVKREENKYSIQSEPYFAFVVRPAKIIEETDTQSADKIKLFDFGEADQIKESFANNVEKDEPLEGPKLYCNIVHHERVLPPLNKDKKPADPNNDRDWHIIPIAFTMPIKRRNITNIECWHFDAHVNSCVRHMMHRDQTKFRSIWNYILQKFQHHNRKAFLFHKQSIKICKKKKYKNPLGNSQTVQKFILPKEMETAYFNQAFEKLQKDAKA